MQSRTFSGFSIVRSMHEKGFYEMRLTMEFPAGVKKIKTFLKKLLFFFKKTSCHQRQEEYKNRLYQSFDTACFYIYKIIYYRLEVQITVIFHFSFFVEVIDETASITSCHIRQVVFFVFSIKFFCTFFFVINLNHVNTCITLDRTS